MKHSTVFSKVLVLVAATTVAAISTSCVSENAYIRKESEANYANSDAYYSRQRAAEAEAKAKREQDRAEYYRKLNSQKASTPKTTSSGDFEPVR